MQQQAANPAHHPASCGCVRASVGRCALPLLLLSPPLLFCFAPPPRSGCGPLSSPRTRCCAAALSGLAPRSGARCADCGPLCAPRFIAVSPSLYPPRYTSHPLLSPTTPSFLVLLMSLLPWISFDHCRRCCRSQHRPLLRQTHTTRSFSPTRKTNFWQRICTLCVV